MSYDAWKLRSDLDELAKNHVHIHEDEDESVQCVTCGEWLRDDDKAYLVGWDRNPEITTGKQWECDTCHHRNNPDRLAGLHAEQKWDDSRS